MITLDLNILPIRRINSQESAEMPGLLAVTPPRKTVHGREHTSLIVYLSLSGNVSPSNAELKQWTGGAATLFYQSPGSLTFAMRNVANDINSKLLSRNLSVTGTGQQMLALLVLAAIRENQCTLLLSGPAHAVWVTDGASRHIHEPALSGKGLGSGQSASVYLSQVELHPQDLLVLCGIFPRDWEADLLNERPPASLDASYRKLTFTKGDLNAVLVQAQSGHGIITLLKPAVKPAPQALPQPASSSTSTSAVNLAPVDQPAPAPVVEETIPPVETQDSQNQEAPVSGPPSPITEEQLDSLADFAAHLVQPSAYAIPPQPQSAVSLPREEPKPNGGRGFPASIPRAAPVPEAAPPQEETPPVETEEVSPPVAPRRRRRRGIDLSAHAAATRQMAKTLAGGIGTGRRLNERLRGSLQRFVPRLLPGADSTKPLVIPTSILVLIAIVIPVVVVTVASIVYLRFGQSIQYDEFYGQALNIRAQAISEADPARQRDEWQSILTALNKAEQYRETDESRALRSEAQANLDRLMGVIRLEFIPAFPNGLGSSTQISRLAASESDLYMLEANSGKILHASFTGKSLEMDKAFNCQPGSYGGYQVGRLIDILALPKVNALNAAVMGIDANGNLLYCAPDQVAQAIPLPSLPNMSWARLTSFALDSGDLYVLDAQQHAIWIYPGKDSTFIDPPTFYFGNEIPPNIETAIDLAVSGEDLYMLHADGHLSACRLSPLSEVPTRCQDPAPRVDNNPAHRDMDIFTLAHFTQLAVTNPPNPVIMLLDSENRSVFRFSPRAFELQNQVTGYAGKANPFQRGPVSAMAVSPNYVLYFAIGDQVYFATNLP